MGRSDVWRAARRLFSRPRRTVLYGKLWGLYAFLSGVGPFEGPDYQWPSGRNDYLVEIDDVTQDIDTPGQYEELLKALGRGVPRAAQLT